MIENFQKFSQICDFLYNCYLKYFQTITDEVDSDTGPDTEVISGKAVADAIGQDDNSKLEEALGSLPPRWKNWVIRGVFTWLMIGGFGLIIYGGPLALMLTVITLFHTMCPNKFWTFCLWQFDNFYLYIDLTILTHLDFTIFIPFFKI